MHPPHFFDWLRDKGRSLGMRRLALPPFRMTRNKSVFSFLLFCFFGRVVGSEEKHVAA